MKFTDDESYLFLRMIDYFIRSEKKEIEELKLPSGNKDFIHGCEKRLEVFESIKKKVSDAFDFDT